MSAPNELKPMRTAYVNYDNPNEYVLVTPSPTEENYYQYCYNIDPDSFGKNVFTTWAYYPDHYQLDENSFLHNPNIPIWEDLLENCKELDWFTFHIGNISNDNKSTKIYLKVAYPIQVHQFIAATTVFDAMNDTRLFKMFNQFVSMPIDIEYHETAKGIPCVSIKFENFRQAVKELSKVYEAHR